LESAWTERELDEMALEENGRQYVGVEEGKVMGSIGCYLPVDGFDRYVLSYVHIAPWCRRRGIARYLISWILQKYGPGCRWWCYIEPENEASMKLFEYLKWKKIDDRPGENGMFTYEIYT
jgi:ribosomal protein S18 acetylase RimI-like enzyme